MHTAGQKTVDAKRRYDMLEALILEMIRYYSGDAKRIQHFIKVHSYVRLIAASEHLEERTRFTAEAAAVVHDIAIHLCEEKYKDCSGALQEKEGPALARQMLDRLGFAPDVTDRVCYLVGHHHTYDAIDGMDYQILVEADFLVNLCEEEEDADAARTVCRKIFKTGTGKEILRGLYALEQEEP